MISAEVEVNQINLFTVKKLNLNRAFHVDRSTDQRLLTVLEVGNVSSWRGQA
jgi:hypothetical protein